MKNVILLCFLFIINLLLISQDKNLINRTILIMPTLNVNNNQENEYLSGVIRDSIRAKLDFKNIFHFISYEKVDKQIKDNNLLPLDFINYNKSIPIALTFGADVIVTSKFIITGEKIMILCNAFDILTGETLVTTNVSGKIGIEIIDYIDKISETLSEKMSAKFKNIDKVVLENIIIEKYGQERLKALREEQEKEFKLNESANKSNTDDYSLNYNYETEVFYKFFDSKSKIGKISADKNISLQAKNIVDKIDSKIIQDNENYFWNYEFKFKSQISKFEIENENKNFGAFIKFDPLIIYGFRGIYLKISSENTDKFIIEIDNGKSQYYYELLINPNINVYYISIDNFISKKNTSNNIIDIITGNEHTFKIKKTETTFLNAINFDGKSYKGSLKIEEAGLYKINTDKSNAEIANFENPMERNFFNLGFNKEVNTQQKSNELLKKIEKSENIIIKKLTSEIKKENGYPSAGNYLSTNIKFEIQNDIPPSLINKYFIKYQYESEIYKYDFITFLLKVKGTNKIKVSIKYNFEKKEYISFYDLNIENENWNRVKIPFKDFYDGYLKGPTGYLKILEIASIFDHDNNTGNKNFDVTIDLDEIKLLK